MSMKFPGWLPCDIALAAQYQKFARFGRPARGRQVVNQIIESVQAFLRDSGSRQQMFYNEAELQHELGYWLRTRLPVGMSVYFERPAHSFRPQAIGLIKTEIDLVVAPADGSWHFPIELKCHRQQHRRVPETMFDVCIDLRFLEDLIRAGFRGGLFVMHVEHTNFYKSRLQTGIYSYFRSGASLCGTIQKPTGSKARSVCLNNAYQILWQQYDKARPCRYWLQVFAPTSADPPEAP